MPKFEVFYPGAGTKNEPPKQSAPEPKPAPEPRKRVRVMVWQGGRLVECKKRERKPIL